MAFSRRNNNNYDNQIVESPNGDMTGYPIT